MNSNPISPLFRYFSDLGKRSSRDNDTDLMVSIMTDLVSTVVVRGFSGLGGRNWFGLVWPWVFELV